MISNLPVFWQLMAVTTVITLSYPLALILNGLMKQDAFGTVVNMAIITGGFFATLYLVDQYGGKYGVHVTDLQENIIAGTIGATALSFTLSLLRVGISKL